MGVSAASAAPVSNASVACLPASKVCELTGISVQTLRNYETRGLVVPARLGKQRLFSQADVQKLRLVSKLSSELNANARGIKLFVSLLDRVKAQEEEIADLRAAVRNGHAPAE